MKAKETIIAWNGNDGTYALRNDAPRGSAVGPFIDTGDLDWCTPYESTGGASFVDRRKLLGTSQQSAVMLDWYALVFSYGIDSYIAHRAFLEIDEYQFMIKRVGLSPAKDEPGHDPSIGYDRCGEFARPNLKVFTIGRSVHVCPL